jgi:hypothetical protein
MGFEWVGRYFQPAAQILARLLAVECQRPAPRNMISPQTLNYQL